MIKLETPKLIATEPYLKEHHYRPDDCIAQAYCGHLDWKCYITLRYNEGAVQPYVTHWFNAESGGYNFGHYFANLEDAMRDFIERMKVPVKHDSLVIFMEGGLISAVFSDAKKPPTVIIVDYDDGGDDHPNMMDVDGTKAFVGVQSALTFDKSDVALEPIIEKVYQREEQWSHG